MMRALRFLQAGALCILIAGSLVLYAQDDKRQAEPQRPEQPRPEANQDKMNPPRQQETKPARQDKQEKAEKQQEKPSREQMKGDRQMNTAQQGHPRRAGKSAHIPDNRFRENFGRSHTFVVQRPVVVEDQPGFVYGGYSFVFVDAWPEDWAYTDDCYVDYIDGDYFLFDLMHPGVRLALFVVL